MVERSDHNISYVRLAIWVKTRGNQQSISQIQKPPNFSTDDIPRSPVPTITGLSLERPRPWGGASVTAISLTPFPNPVPSDSGSRGTRFRIGFTDVCFL